MAFTLAEVLITLGIIGVVAAMTIPSLIAKYEKNVIKNQFKKSYANIENAINLTAAKYGADYNCWATYAFSGLYNISECTQFWDELYKNLNIVKTCKYNTDGCGVVYKRKADVIADGGSVPNNSCMFLDSGEKTIVHILNDGSYLITSANDHHKVYFTIDVNGAKGPNKWGYDVFYTMLHKKTLNSRVQLLDVICRMKEKDGYYFNEMITK